MPIGVIVNALAVAFGGLLGNVIKRYLNPEWQDKMNLMFGVCSMSLGIVTIVLMQNLSAVILSVILGTVIGLAVHLEQRISAGAKVLEKGIAKISGQSGEEGKDAELVTAIVLFCASGTGIYGAMTAGFSGDQSILIVKSIMDFFTAGIFACSAGAVIAMTAIPQFCVFMLLFLLANAIMPFLTPAMIADFKACGGIIMLATGLRIAKIKMFPIADMLPAMFIVMPVSALWTLLMSVL